MIEKRYMQRAIELAKKGMGFTNPNPMVGAVIVKDGRIIGEGYHEKYGGLHAERNAIAHLSESAEGATIYVTLEPCCHYGKTPPCTEAIIENKIKQVVIGSRDPNPLVAGKGVQMLRNHGIEVIEDFMKEECDEINPVFFHYITKKKPYITMKYAMTADGKIATKTGKSKWITGSAAREKVQFLRHKNMGILVGIGTVLADDPMLNVRVEGLKTPIRIICDSQLRIPLDSQIVKTAKEYKTIVACTVNDQEKIKALKAAGVQVEIIGDKQKINIESEEPDIITIEQKKNTTINLSELMVQLGNLGIDSILVEGGGSINDSLLKEGLVNELKVFIAPKIFGGKDALSPVEGNGIDCVEEATSYHLKEVERIGEDILLSYVNDNSVGVRSTKQSV